MAIERTHLANERTFLAYFRTALVFLSGGVAILQMEVLREIRPLGFFLLAASPFILGIGIFRLLYVKRQIKKYYKYSK